MNLLNTGEMLRREIRQFLSSLPNLKDVEVGRRILQGFLKFNISNIILGYFDNKDRFTLLDAMSPGMPYQKEGELGYEAACGVPHYYV